MSKALAAAALALGLGSHPTPARVGVSATEFHLTLSRPAVKAGVVEIELQNDGQDPHDLRVRRVGGSHTFSIPLVPSVSPLFVAVGSTPLLNVAFGATLSVLPAKADAATSRTAIRMISFFISFSYTSKFEFLLLNGSPSVDDMITSRVRFDVDLFQVLEIFGTQYGGLFAKSIPKT